VIAAALLYVQVAFGGGVYAVPVAPQSRPEFVQLMDLPVCRPYELDFGSSSIDASA